MDDRPKCAGVDPELFHLYTERLEAAKFCEQCPVQSQCLQDALATHTVDSVRAGYWFGKDGTYRKIRMKKPPEPLGFALQPDEYTLEKRLFRYAAVTVPTRHQVWQPGPVCQSNSRRHGDPCKDDHCRILYNAYQARHRRLREGKAA